MNINRSTNGGQEVYCLPVAVDLDGGLELQLIAITDTRGRLQELLQADTERTMYAHSMWDISFLQDFWRWKEEYPTILNIEQRKLRICEAVKAALLPLQTQQKEESVDSSQDVEVTKLSRITAA